MKPNNHKATVLQRIQSSVIDLVLVVAAATTTFTVFFFQNFDDFILGNVIGGSTLFGFLHTAQYDSSTFVGST